jgi:hypothetical protein
LKTGTSHLFISRAFFEQTCIFPTKSIERAITPTTPAEKRIRYKFYLEFKVIRLNNLKGVSLEVMDKVGKCFVLPGETI